MDGLSCNNKQQHFKQQQQQSNSRSSSISSSSCSRQGCTLPSSASRNRKVVSRLHQIVASQFGATVAAIIVVTVSIAAIVLIAITFVSARSTLLSPTATMESVGTATTTTTSTAAKSNQQQPFSLMVKLTFTELQYMQQFLTDIAPLCQYIQQYESNTTLSYEVLLSDRAASLEVLIVERYVDKEQAFLQIHKTSLPFLEFRAKLQMMQHQNYVKVDGSSYYDSGIGFIQG